MGNILDELISAGIVQIIPVGYEKEHTNCAYCEAGVGEDHEEEAGE